MRNQNLIYDQEEQIYNLSSRFFILYVFITLLFIILSTRLWYLQIIKGDILKNISVKNQVKQKKIMAPRGYILDREGRVLVDNTLVSQLTLNVQGLKDKERQAITKKIAPILNLTPKQVDQRIKRSIKKNGRFFPAIIADNLTIDQNYALKLMRIEHPLLNVEEFIFRTYPFGRSGAQLFGYVSQVSKNQLNNKDVIAKQLFPGDIIGKKGLEKKWDAKIRGKDGLTYVQVDAHGRVTDIEENILETSSLAPIPPQSGNHIQLTIDLDIQEAAYKAFQREDKIGPRIGALVALNRKGEVLAWVSEPSYDSNKFLYGISNSDWNTLISNAFKPLRNKVIQDNFSPGSTFKPITGIAALETGRITPQTKMNSPGFVLIGRRRFHNHSAQGHGQVNILSALETSSNSFFYKLVRDYNLDIETMAKYAHAFGLGKKTNIGLEDEVSGLLPTSTWMEKNEIKYWQKGDSASFSVGQGPLDVTPLQMALTYLSIGNEGFYYKPLLVKKILSGKDQEKVLEEFKPQLIRDLSKEDAHGLMISKATFKSIKEGLFNVTNGERGTAKWWKIPHVKFAGKTGTSQVRSFSASEIYKPCMKRPVFERHHGWFVGYAPHDDPEIVVAVLTMHSCSGSSGSAPLARDVMEAYMRKYHPEKFKSGKKVVGF